MQFAQGMEFHTRIESSEMQPLPNQCQARSGQQREGEELLGLCGTPARWEQSGRSSGREETTCVVGVTLCALRFNVSTVRLGVDAGAAEARIHWSHIAI